MHLRVSLCTALAIMNAPAATRPLTQQERSLAQWMLEHGNPEAPAFLAQLANAGATTWRCPCGCASFDFKVEGKSAAPPRVHILGDFIVGEGDAMFGIFVFESGGTLSGLEVYSLGTTGSGLVFCPQPA